MSTGSVTNRGNGQSKVYKPFVHEKRSCVNTIEKVNVSKLIDNKNAK